MASASAVIMASPSATASTAVIHRRPLAAAGLQPMRLSRGKSGRTHRLQVRASAMKEKAAAVATAAAMAAALVVPEVAEAAGPGLSPSLKNFLLSIVAGGVVLTVLVGAVIGVSNFDPVKRS